MDLTYIAGLMLSVVSGCAVAIAFVLLKAKSLVRWWAAAIALAVIFDFALLINWGEVDRDSMVVLLVDLIFFAVYGAVGVVVGAVPVLGARELSRFVRSRLASNR